MYKFKILTSADGTAKNQEMYEWLTANCSDLFDSITINSGQTRVSCNIGESEVLGFSSTSSKYQSNIYWKGSALFSNTNSTNYYRYFYSIYRVNNAVFVCFQKYNDFSDKTFKIPTHGFIKSDNDMFFIDVRMTVFCGGYLEMSNTTTTWYCSIHSYNDGNGAKVERAISSYYHKINNTASLLQMRCTNDYGTLIPGAYWLKQSPTRDTGLITINGKEYFSNGVFCILNE